MSALRTPLASTARCRTLLAALVGASLGSLVPSARAQVASVPPPPEARQDRNGESIGPPAPPLPLVLAAFDVSGATTFPAQVLTTSSTMTSTFITGRIAPVIPVTPRLFLAFPIDGGVSFYQFQGDPQLIANGRIPWDQVRTYALGAQGRYKFDDHWAAVAEVNIASAGARGAPFGETISGGATFGATYRFSKQLTVGLVLTMQTRLARGLFVLPLPAVEWVLPFDEGRWRLVAGSLRAGPGRAAGLGIAYAPIQQLSVTLGAVFVGLGREFRLPADIPAPAEVGRDGALPLLLGIDFRPVRHLHLTLWGGVSVFRAITVFSGDGAIVNDRDVAPAPLIGGTIAFGL